MCECDAKVHGNTHVGTVAKEAAVAKWNTGPGLSAPQPKTKCWKRSRLRYLLQDHLWRAPAQGQRARLDPTAGHHPDQAAAVQNPSQRPRIASCGDCRIAAKSASSNSEEDLERLVQEAGLAPSESQKPAPSLNPDQPATRQPIAGRATRSAHSSQAKQPKLVATNTHSSHNASRHSPTEVRSHNPQREGGKDQLPAERGPHPENKRESGQSEPQ